LSSNSQSSFLHLPSVGIACVHYHVCFPYLHLDDQGCLSNFKALPKGSRTFYQGRREKKKGVDNLYLYKQTKILSRMEKELKNESPGGVRQAAPKLGWQVALFKAPNSVAC
jgi:hypothetical protein